MEKLFVVEVSGTQATIALCGDANSPEPDFEQR